MSLFEFVVTLFSIVIALGVARVLSGFAGLIEFRSNIQHKPLFTLWLVYLLLAQIVWWFSIWDRSRTESMTLGLTIILFYVPACLFLAARLLVPSDSEMHEMSTRFETVRVPFLLFLAAPIIPGPLIAGFGLGDWVIASYLLPIAAVLLASVPFTNIRVQYGAVVAVLLIYIAFTIQYRYEVTL
jgi:hypothetical protein